MRIGKICSLEKEINVVYNIIAEDIFQFILYSYFTSHKTIIQEISRIHNPAFSINKVYKFKYFSNSFGQKNAEDRLHFLP
mgnify:CR=1 FL=1